MPRAHSASARAVTVLLSMESGVEVRRIELPLYREWTTPWCEASVPTAGCLLVGAAKACKLSSARERAADGEARTVACGACSQSCPVFLRDQVVFASARCCEQAAEGSVAAVHATTRKSPQRDRTAGFLGLVALQGFEPRT